MQSCPRHTCVTQIDRNPICAALNHCLTGVWRQYQLLLLLLVVAKPCYVTAVSVLPRITAAWNCIDDNFLELEAGHRNSKQDEVQC